jgi:hypothetical protein
LPAYDDDLRLKIRGRRADAPLEEVLMTMLVVPATVPDAQVRRLPRAELEAPILISAAPAPVPVARVVPIVPAMLTVEQVEQLRRENSQLRAELARVRAS